MFEDSTFESTGRIHTRSRRWMIATLFFNGSILVALILIPLFYPETLPHQFMSFLLTTPPAPVAPEPAPKQPLHPLHGSSDYSHGVIVTPTRILPTIKIFGAPEDPAGPLLAMNETSGLPGDFNNVFHGHGQASVVRPENKGPVRLPSTLVAGLLIYKITPPYPPIAKAAGVEGTVVLQATISKSGTIVNLRTVSGHPMLQQAALDAVKSWRYRPYLLNNQPVEVETTVNVVFSLGR